MPHIKQPQIFDVAESFVIFEALTVDRKSYTPLAARRMITLTRVSKPLKRDNSGTSNPLLPSFLLTELSVLGGRLIHVLNESVVVGRVRVKC